MIVHKLFFILSFIHGDLAQLLRKENRAGKALHHSGDGSFMKATLATDEAAALDSEAEQEADAQADDAETDDEEADDAQADDEEADDAQADDTETDDEEADDVADVQNPGQNNKKRRKRICMNGKGPRTKKIAATIRHYTNWNCSTPSDEYKDFSLSKEDLRRFSDEDSDPGCARLYCHNMKSAKMACKATGLRLVMYDSKQCRGSGVPMSRKGYPSLPSGFFTRQQCVKDPSTKNLGRPDLWWKLEWKVKKKKEAQFYPCGFTKEGETCASSGICQGPYQVNETWANNKCTNPGGKCTIANCCYEAPDLPASSCVCADGTSGSLQSGGLCVKNGASCDRDLQEFPCNDKSEGDSCIRCPPGSSDCNETQYVNTCQGGECKATDPKCDTGVISRYGNFCCKTEDGKGDGCRECLAPQSQQNPNGCTMDYDKIDTDANAKCCGIYSIVKERSCTSTLPPCVMDPK